LNAAYPELAQWTRDEKPHGYWKDHENQRAFFDKLGKSLNIQKPEDWYNVGVRTAMIKGGSFLRHYNGSLIDGTFILYSIVRISWVEYINFIIALNVVYPHYNLKKYNASSFANTRAVASKAQSALYEALRTLFPGTFIQQNFRAVPRKTFHSLDVPLAFVEFDVSFKSVYWRYTGFWGNFDR
jgi:hypothetical protein